MNDTYLCFGMQYCLVFKTDSQRLTIRKLTQALFYASRGEYSNNPVRYDFRVLVSLEFSSHSNPWGMEFVV